MQASVKTRGFTLIEMLTVIVIISILIGVIYVSFGTARENARNKAFYSSLKETQLAMELFKAQNGYYPIPNGSCGADSAAPDTPSGNAKKFSQYKVCKENFLPGLVPEYLKAVPANTMSHNTNCSLEYYVHPDGTSYKIVAVQCLEGSTAATGLQWGDEFSRYPISCQDIAGLSPTLQTNIQFYSSPAVYGGWRYCIDVSDNVDNY